MNTVIDMLLHSAGRFLIVILVNVNKGSSPGIKIPKGKMLGCQYHAQVSPTDNFAFPALYLIQEKTAH